MAALAILDRLDVVDVDTLGWWLAERQLHNGGLNGRPEKLEDVSWIFFFEFENFSLSYPATPLVLFSMTCGSRRETRRLILFDSSLDPILCLLFVLNFFFFAMAIS